MIISISYLICAILFIFSVYSLSSPKNASFGNTLAILAASLAILTCLATNINHNHTLIYSILIEGILVGSLAGISIKMPALPQMVATLNGLGGLASSLIVITETELWPHSHLLLNTICLIIGIITFSGSLIAFFKLQGILRYTPNFSKWLSLILFLSLIILEYLYLNNRYPIFISKPHLFYLITLSALFLGITFSLPIGGADMPIIISILNALSGWAIVLVGFSLQDILLIIVGSLIGTSGSILSYIMTGAMNRSLKNILWPPRQSINLNHETEVKNIKTGTPAEAAFLLSNSRKVIIVPGFGMAAAQAQNALKNMADLLQQKYQVDVKFAIHPVAGRMPGHMNVLLAEAKIPYENVYEMNDINNEFSTTDIAYIIGANDITNPAAQNDSTSPLYGMPILDVSKARTVFFVKRSLAAGYSGIDNALFYAPNTIMLLGDAKIVTEDIIKDL